MCLFIDFWQNFFSNFSIIRHLNCLHIDAARLSSSLLENFSLMRTSCEVEQDLGLHASTSILHPLVKR